MVKVCRYDRGCPSCCSTSTLTSGYRAKTAASGWRTSNIPGCGGANLDGEFKSSDMVTAFVVGGYEQGPRTDPVAVAVSELGAWLLLSLAIAASTDRASLSRAR